MGDVLALNMIKPCLLVIFAGTLNACSMTPTPGSVGDLVFRQEHPTFEFQNQIQAEKPQVAVNIPRKTNASARFVKELTQDDGTEIWITGNNIAIYMRDGLISGSRGLGGDLLAADVSQSLHRIKNQSAGYAKRFHTELSGGGQATLKEFQCDISGPKHWINPTSSAPENMDLVEEICRGDKMSFRNFYWVEAKSGRIVKSRQWVSPALGYITIKFL